MNHLISTRKNNEKYNFLVIEDRKLLTSTLKEYLHEHGRSTEIVLNLKVLPSTMMPRPENSAEEPDWIGSISTDRIHITTGGYDGFIRLYDLKSRKIVATSSSAHNGAVKDVDVRKDFVLSASKDRTAAVWQRNGKSLNQVAVCEGHNDSVETVSIRPSCKDLEFVTAGWDKIVRQYKFSSSSDEKEENVETNEDNEGRRSKRQKNSKGDGVVSGLRRLQPLSTLMGHTGAVTCSKWLDDDKLCTGSYDRSVRRRCDFCFVFLSPNLTHSPHFACRYVCGT